MSRTAYSELLYKSLTDLGYKGELLIGKTSKKINLAQLREDSSYQFVVANDRMASEALDIPYLKALHLPYPSLNFPKLEQKLGRIRRVFYGTDLIPRVYDYYDNLAYTTSI